MTKRETPPNIARMLANKEITQAIHDFLAFASDKGYQLGNTRCDKYHTEFIGTEGPRLDALLYAFIDVDPDELEQEKQALLASL